jgi:serine/threonine-protein kinase
MKRISQDNWAVLSPLLDEALELPPDRRSAWLAGQRIRHPDLVQHLEELLNRDPELDEAGFLSEARSPELPPVSSLAGQELGAYRLERLLGQGGMGSVWLARRSDGRFEGVAAIKFLSLAVAGPVGEARFRREGSVLARLTHPNIARLLDAGVTPAGQPYLVLDHVDGQPLDAWCDECRLSAEGRLQLFQQVLAAVAHAHANLIVHRDLKPSNIMVTRDGTVKLLDFGIAKLLEEGGPDRTALTASHEAVLTFEYAAPEQLRGESISTATDVYSLGVVLYQLLAGRHPTNVNCHTPAEHVRAILDTDPGQLSRAVTPSATLSREDAHRLAAARDASPEKLRRVYAGDLDNILGKALRKNPAERYPTVTAFADDLAHYLNHEPVSARPDAWSYRAGRFLRRHRGSVSGAVLVTLALIGAALLTAFQAREARRQRDAAIYQSKRADAQIEFQNLLMSEVGDQPLTMREILDRGRALLERQYGEDSRFLGTILLQLAARYGELGDNKAQGDILAKAESLALAGHGAENLTEIRCDMVDNLRSQGRYDKARSLLDRTDSMVRADRDPNTEALCLQIRAQLEDETGQGDSSVVAIRRAIAIKDSLGETSDMSYLTLLGTFADALMAQDRLREAQPVYQRALTGMDSSGRGGMMARVIMQHNLALTLIHLGETREAEAVLHDVLRRAARGSPSGEAPTQPLIHYAETALYQGRADSSAIYFAQLVRQAVRDTSLYWEGRGLFGLARAQVQLGQLSQARRSATRFQQIRAVYPHVQDTDDVIPDVLMLQGLLACAKGDTATAYERFSQALKSNGYFEGKRKRRLRPVVILAAETGLVLGRVDEALGLARDAEATAMVDSLAETRSAYVGEARVIEGRALLAKRDTSGARAALEKALPALRLGAGAEHPRTREAEMLLGQPH